MIYSVSNCTLDNKKYISVVMEEIHNATTLTDTIKRGLLTKSQIYIIYQMLVNLCTEFNITHLDLHGANIIFNGEGRPYIIDFGEIGINDKCDTFKFELTVTIGEIGFTIKLPDCTIYYKDANREEITIPLFIGQYLNQRIYQVIKEKKKRRGIHEKRSIFK